MCSFHFNGYEGKVPTFMVDGSKPDTPMSPGIETNLKGSEVGVVNANSAGAEYLCAGDMAGMNLDPNQFYVTGQVRIQRTLSQS